jgi:1,5-anhydro-D-fructose reductase (1,5-anhydro-D-mannitol-forming)
MLNWVVVGIGDISTKRSIPAILAEGRSRLYGLVTRNPAKAAPYGARVWTSLEEAMRDPSIDAVYISSPVFLHAPHTMLALQAGKHVLCEKPMAMNYAEACAMQGVAEETGNTLGIAYYRRMYPKLRRAKQLLEAGAVGRPVVAEATCHSWFNDEDGTRSWLLKRSTAGGGPLYDIASHRIDAFNYLFGTPMRACGHTSNLVHVNEVEDNATVLVDYESGVRGIVDVRWHSRIARDEFRIRGLEGEINLTPLNGPTIVFPGGSEELPPHHNLHFPCVENFVKAVLDGEPLAASGASSLLTDQVTGWVTEQAAVRYHGI